MLKRLPGLVFFVLLITAQAGRAQSAQEFSDKIGGTTDSLYLLASEWVNSFLGETYGDKQYHSLKPLRSHLEKFINAELGDYTKATDVAGSDKLKASVVSLLTFEKKLVEEAFTPFEKLSANSPDGAVEDCGQRLKKMCNEEAEYISKVNQERRTYAMNNHVSLEPPETERVKPTGPAPKIPHIIIKHPDRTESQKPESENPGEEKPKTPERPVPAKAPVKKTPEEKEEDEDKD